MDLVDQIIIHHQDVDCSIKLFVGDLATIPTSEAVDLLVVSAFPDDYLPTHTSLIGALDRRGVSIEALAKDKAVDLREFSACWLSTEIETPQAGFRRILCFEPGNRGRAPQVVGDIFRSIIPFTNGSPAIRQVAMPLLASGHQGESEQVMLEALVEGAAHWLSIGLPLECIKIVAHDPDDAGSLQMAFASLKSKFIRTLGPTRHFWRYDLFVSYSHQDKEEVDALITAIREFRPSIQMFVDRLELRPGAAWQQHIFDAIDQSRKVAAVLSPDYLASKICLDEYNIAHLRHRESTEGVLQPVYLRTASLPTYMRLIQYIDARAEFSSGLFEGARQLNAVL